MDKVQMVKQEVQENQWQNIIKECRDSGMSTSKWCKENGINVKPLLLFDGENREIFLLYTLI